MGEVKRILKIGDKFKQNISITCEIINIKKTNRGIIYIYKMIDNLSIDYILKNKIENKFTFLKYSSLYEDAINNKLI